MANHQHVWHVFIQCHAGGRDKRLSQPLLLKLPWGTAWPVVLGNGLEWIQGERVLPDSLSWHWPTRCRVEGGRERQRLQESALNRPLVQAS